MTPDAGTPVTGPVPDGQQGRDAAIDFLRGACILYIVGYWHLVPYTNAFPAYANTYTECVKDIALGTFVFCSGLLLAGRRIELTRSGLAAFYLRRVLRIYPLYVIALLLFDLTGLAGKADIVNAVLLLSMFIPPAPYTLWFVTMIMTFYLFTPFLVRLADYPGYYVLGGIALLAAGVLVHGQIHSLDTRIIQYLPCFLLGVAWKRIPGLERLLGARSGLLLALLVVTFLLYRLQHGAGAAAALGRIPAVLAGTLLLYQSVRPLSDRLHSPLIWRLAYASFCIYLFHRLIFRFSSDLYFPDGEYQRLAYLLAVVLPVTVVVAYYVQRVYDRIGRRR